MRSFVSNSLTASVIDTYFVENSSALGRAANTLPSRNLIWTHIIEDSMYYFISPGPHWCNILLLARETNHLSALITPNANFGHVIVSLWSVTKVRLRLARDAGLGLPHLIMIVFFLYMNLLWIPYIYLIFFLLFLGGHHHATMIVCLV